MKDSFLVMLGLGVTAVLGFVYTIIMARNLAPAAFGVFSALTSLVAITFSFGDLGIGPAIINFLPKQKDKKDKIIETGYWFEYFVGFIIFLTFCFLAKFSSLLVPGSLPEHMVLIGSLAFNYILIGYSQAIFTARREFFRFSISQIVDAAIKIFFVILFFRIGELTISTALLANFISVVISLVFTFWDGLWQIKARFDVPTFSHLFEFSKWIAISRLFSVLISRIDIVMLNVLSGSFQAGIYSAASRITLIFALIISSLGSVINPRFSEFKDLRETKKYIGKLILLITSICFLILITIYFAKGIVMFVFGSPYSEAATVFQFLGLSMIPFLFSVITTSTLLYTFGQAKFYAQLTAFQVAIVVFLNWLLIPKMGVYAPVVSQAVANLTFLLLSSLRVTRLFRHKNSEKNIVIQNTPQCV